MKKIVIPALLAAAVLAVPSTSFAKGMRWPSKAVIAHQFQIWNAALQTGDAAKVAALYCDPGGVLLPTVSNQVRTTPAEITNYFEYFLKLKPKGKIDQSYIRILGPGGAVNSGVYTFTLTKDGKTEDVQARYTFVYDKVHGKWCIMDHHSSAMPEK